MSLDLNTVQAALTAETHALSVPRPRLGPVNVWVLPAGSGAVHYLCLSAGDALTELSSVAQPHLGELLRSRCAPPWEPGQLVALAAVPATVIAARDARLARRARLREALQTVGAAIRIGEDGRFGDWLHRARDGVEIVTLSEDSIEVRERLPEDRFDSTLDRYLAGREPDEPTVFPSHVSSALDAGLARFEHAWAALQEGKLGLVIRTGRAVTASAGSLWNVAFAKSTPVVVTDMTKIPPWNQKGMEDQLRTYAARGEEVLARFTVPVDEEQRAALAALAGGAT
jgi:hypothetical protein